MSRHILIAAWPIVQEKLAVYCLHLVDEGIGWVDIRMYGRHFNMIKAPFEPDDISTGRLYFQLLQPEHS